MYGRLWFWMLILFVFFLISGIAILLYPIETVGDNTTAEVIFIVLILSAIIFFFIALADYFVN